MALGDYRIVPGLVTEEIGQEILVCDTDLALVHRVSGPAADVLRQVLATGGEPVALESDDITSGLVAAGVLVAAGAPGDLVSRRSFVSGAAAVGAIGIVTLALPRAAAASSVVEPSGGGGGPTTPPESTGVEGDFSVLTSSGANTPVELRWRSLTVPFTYTYVITRDSDGAVLASGSLNSGSLVEVIASTPTGVAITVVVDSQFGAQVTKSTIT